MGKSFISDFVIPVLLSIDGLICASMAIFAYQMGLDPNISWGCLLYTSDAADERSSVDLGGRRIIKKKKKYELSRCASTYNRKEMSVVDIK